MPRNYVYLVSGLKELSYSPGMMPMTMDDLFQLCEDELHPADFIDFKKMFLFNDIENACYHQNENHVYKNPSFYSREEFDENMKDTDSFLPFLAEYFFHKKSERRLYPDLMEIDEIVMLFYEYLDSFATGFVKEYFLFERNLQNITTAMTLRQEGQSPGQYVIQSGFTSQVIAKSTSSDFGLTGDMPFITDLISAYDSGDPVRIEETIERARWDWLDDMTEMEYFTLPAVLAYGVKLASLQRWYNMTEERGREVFDSLLQTIEDSLVFPEEFKIIGGRK